MKKALLLALAAMMILASLTFALAEEREAGLFELLDNDGGNLSRISSAVPVAEGVVIAPAALLPKDADRLVISDGAAQWKAKAVIPDDTGSIAMVFYDPEEYSAQYGFWQLLPWGASVSIESCRVYSTDANGEVTDCGVLDSGEIRWKGQRCLLLSLTDAAPAGSAVLTGSGQLAGVVIAEWAEGINRVLVMPTDVIAGEVSKAIMLLGNLPGWGEAPEGLKVTMKKNRVTIDWKEMALPEKKDGEKLYMVLVDMGNSYLNYYPAETNARSLSLLLTPGRFYIIGAVATASSPDSLPESYALISVPAAEKLTEYNFHAVLTTIAEAPEEGLKGNERPVPLGKGKVTEELLRSGRAYFYSHSTYEVTRNIEGKSLLISLTDPNGVNYTYESSWIYMPEYNRADVWFLSLNETGLIDGLNQNGYPKSVYRVDYYVGGDLADSFEFELK